MQKKVVDTLKFVIGWPLSLVALFFIFRLISPNLSNIKSELTTINIPVLFLGIVCFLGYYLFRTVLWHEIIKHKGVSLPLRETIYLWSISEINRYIPGNIWAFLARGMRFGEKKLSKKELAASLIQESLFVLAGALCISLLSISYLTNIQFLEPFFRVITPQVLTAIVVFLIILFIFQKHILAVFGKPFERISFLSSFSAAQNAVFLLLSIAALSLFGSGYYFAISSVTPLPVSEFFGISSFAVVALLIGFLSLLTPTGLGVREGVLTFGLAKVLPLSLAGFAALFARIVLILSEVLFLALATFWVRTRHQYARTIEKLIKHNLPVAFLLLGITIYTLYISVASFERYTNFNTGRYDLGNMVQTVWNTSQGRIFEFTNPDGVEVVSRMAFHADVILVFFAPFYWIFPHPNLLLFVQALVVGLGALFVYGIAFHILKHRWASVLIALAYLINPSVQRSNLYDFHAVVLGTTFLLASWYFMLKKRYILLAVFLLLAGITKEQVWAITALYGLTIILTTAYSFYKQKTKLSYLFLSKKFLLGLSVTVVSILLFYVTIWHLIPGARGGGEHFALSFYGDFGNSPSDLVQSVIFEPVRVFQTMISGARLDYLKQLLAPVGYMPLLFPITLVFAGPDLMINLLSSNDNFHQIYYQYTATITPFLFISTIYALYVIHRFLPQVSVFVLSSFVFGMAVYGAYQYGPLPGSVSPNVSMFDNHTPNREEIADYLQTIPKDLKVASTNNAGSHLSEREYIFTLPTGFDEADILVFLIDTHPRRDVEHKQTIIELLNNPNYILLKQLDNFYVFQKTRYLTTYF